jgi:hypothetical protein
MHRVPLLQLPLLQLLCLHLLLLTSSSCEWRGVLLPSKWRLAVLLACCCPLGPKSRQRPLETQPAHEPLLLLLLGAAVAIWRFAIYHNTFYSSSSSSSRAV